MPSCWGRVGSGGCKVPIAQLGRQLRLPHSTHSNELDRAQATLAAVGRLHGGRDARDLALAPHKLRVAWRDAPESSQAAHPTAAELLRVAALVEARVRARLAQNFIDLAKARPVQPRPAAHGRIVEPELRPAASALHPPSSQLPTALLSAALEAADDTHVDIGLADGVLL